MRLALVVGFGALALVTTACSKKDDSSSTTTTNGDSLTSTAPSASAAPAASNLPSAPGMGLHGGQRRQAFMDVCTGKNANDPCTVNLGARTITGTCFQIPGGPNQGQLSCRPAPGQLGPHHPGMDSPQMATPGSAPLRPGDPGYQPPPARPAAAN